MSSRYYHEPKSRHCTGTKPHPPVGPLDDVPERAPQGVLVMEVRPDADAALAGLRRGDIIVEANRRPTPDVDALRAALGGDDAAALLVHRGGVETYVFVD